MNSTVCVCTFVNLVFRKPFLRDEFIGRAFLHLSDISAMGKEKELKLFSLSKRVVQSKKHETGMVKVRLRIVGVRKNLAPEVS